MSATVAVGHAIDWGLPRLSDMFARTGGKMPKGEYTKRWDLNHDYYTPVIASVERAINLIL